MVQAAGLSRLSGERACYVSVRDRSLTAKSVRKPGTACRQAEGHVCHEGRQMPGRVQASAARHFLRAIVRGNARLQLQAAFVHHGRSAVHAGQAELHNLRTCLRDCSLPLRDMLRDLRDLKNVLRDSRQGLRDSENTVRDSGNVLRDACIGLPTAAFNPGDSVRSFCFCGQGVQRKGAHDKKREHRYWLCSLVGKVSGCRESCVLTGCQEQSFCDVCTA